MAEVLATLGTALEAVTKFNSYVLTPIMNQFSNLCCYKGNVQSLRDQVDTLNKNRSDLQLEVDEAKRNVEVIGSDVVGWIEEAGKICEKKERIIQDTAQVQQGCFYGLCPNIKLRYRLSREAKKTAEVAQGLLQEANKFRKISYPVRPEPIPTASAGIQIDSRKSKEDEIMDALKDDKVYVIALCGMGGVGKTTMAKKIESKVREGKIFEEVAMTVVSRPLDLNNVQQEIAEDLGLKFDVQTTTARARQLHKRLKETESVLIILDDIWEKFNLQEIGIPSKTTHQRCKIILTSRIQHVCRIIENSAKIIQLDALPELEAWNLFKEKAGEIVDEPELHQIAKDVARECKGLPLALVTVAAALSQSSMASWKDALHQLKASLATDIPEFHEEVYLPLKWSYDQLQNNEARYLFLLCCLFPEDYEIGLHELVEYGFGLGIFGNTINLEGTRNRVYRLVEMLIDRFLLIRIDLSSNDIHSDYYMRYRVKMHDVIRDIAISIASQDKHVFMTIHDRNLREWPKKDCYKNYTCISLSSKNITLSEKVYCPKLELLRVQSRVEIQESFFDGMRGLKVLDTRWIVKFPSSLSWPENLRSLILVGCQLKILPNEICEMVNLEILSLYDSRITLLPKEIGRLKNLRLLDLAYCSDLKNIAPDVISGFVQLEELYMMQFKYWKGVEGNNTSISEVASLTNLTTLQLQADIRSINLVRGSENWRKLTRYRVIIVGNGIIGGNDMGEGENFERYIQLTHFQLDPLTDLVHVLFENAQAVELEGPGLTETANKLSRQGYKNVESLVLRYQDLEFLFDSNSWNLPNTSFLPRLTTLVLKSNVSLKEICRGQPPTGSFSNLTSLTVEFCDGLKNLLSISVASMLSKLEFLSIEFCSFIETVFSEQNGQYGNDVIITFPKLSKIRLYHLERLVALCKATDQVAIEFPQLHEMDIVNCPLLKSFCARESSILLEGDHNAERPFFFDQKVMCNGLKKLKLVGIGSVNLFSNSVSRVMHSLRDLYVDYCEMLQEVIAKDKEEQTNSPKVTLFPQLQNLELINLPNMQQFCHISHGVESPSLKVLKIVDCGLMETFSRNQFTLSKMKQFCHISHGVELPSLKFLDIVYCGLMETFSINQFNLTCSQASDSSFFDEVTCNKLERLSLEHFDSATKLFGHKLSINNFSGLQTVKIWGSQSLRSIFSPEMFRDLVNLQVLIVHWCSKLQEVISKDEKEGETNAVKETIFPQLKTLELHSLPKLIRFCHIKNDLELPSLESLSVSCCPVLETFSLGSVHLASSISIHAKHLGSIEWKVVDNEGRGTIASAFGHGNSEEEDYSDYLAGVPQI